MHSRKSAARRYSPPGSFALSVATAAARLGSDASCSLGRWLRTLRSLRTCEPAQVRVWDLGALPRAHKCARSQMSSHSVCKVARGYGRHLTSPEGQRRRRRYVSAGARAKETVRVGRGRFATTGAFACAVSGPARCRWRRLRMTMRTFVAAVACEMRRASHCWRRRGRQCVAARGG